MRQGIYILRVEENTEMTNVPRSERHSIKLRRTFFRKKLISEEAKERPIAETPTLGYKHIRMELPWSDVQNSLQIIQEKINKHHTAKKVVVKNLNHENAEEFANLYNLIFMTSPDPYRPIRPEEVKLFKEEWTFVAYLYGKAVGFIALTLEEDDDTGEKLGVIAGIGVAPRHRRKGIALALANKATGFFLAHPVDKLVCEVYYENETSKKFIESVGFKEVGYVYI